MRARLVTAFITAATFGVALGVAQAQLVCTIPCPVWDATAVFRNEAINALKDQINALLDQQGDRLHRMAKRLSLVSDFAKYVIADDDTPRWRHHDFDSDAVLFAKAFHAALNYGDASGTGYASVSLPRIAPETVLAALSPDAATYLRRDLATLDLADSTIIRGTDETGRVRYNGRNNLFAIQALQRDVIDPSDDQSVTAVLDKVSGGELVAARQQQTRLQLLAAALEQLLVDSKRDRDRDAVQMNMYLNALRAGEEVGEGSVPPSLSLVDRADEVLRGWRQP